MKFQKETFIDQCQPVIFMQYLVNEGNGHYCSNGTKIIFKMDKDE